MVAVRGRHLTQQERDQSSRCVSVISRHSCLDFPLLELFFVFCPPFTLLTLLQCPTSSLPTCFPQPLSISLTLPQPLSPNFPLPSLALFHPPSPSLTLSHPLPHPPSLSLTLPHSHPPSLSLTSFLLLPLFL